MITINLLPLTAFKAKWKGRVFLTAYPLLLMVMVAMGFMVKTLWLDTELDRLKAQQDNNQTTLTQLKGQVNQAAVITGTTVKKWQQLEAVMDLEERRRDLTRLLVEIERLVPKDNAWLLSLGHNKGTLTLEGASRDKDTVSQFLTRLENASYLDRYSVTLVEISQSMKINNMNLTRFKINAKTKFPQPSILKEGLKEYGLPSFDEFVALVNAAAPDQAAKLRGEEPQAQKSGRRKRL